MHAHKCVCMNMHVHDSLPVSLVPDSGMGADDFTVGISSNISVFQDVGGYIRH